MPKTTTTEHVPCAHCGLPCDTTTFTDGVNSFCCNGCALVFRLLHEQNLDDYYRQHERPGIKPSAQAEPSRFAYLDNPAIAERIQEFGDTTRAHFTFSIPQMHCSSCILLLENLARFQPGIERATVNFMRRELSVVIDKSSTSLRNVVELLARLGYEPTIRLDSTRSDAPKRSATKSLYMKIGIAGFAFANTMLFSVSEYLAFRTAVESDIATFMRYASIALAIPVLLYSASGYMISAFKGLRRRTVTIDVPIALGILVLFIRSVYEIITGVGQGYLDSFTGLVFFLLLGKLFQQKTYDRLSFDRDYRSYFPLSVLRKDQSGESSIPVTDLAIGDRIIIRNKEIIPADAILVNGTAFLDYSFVTGESEPVDATVGARVYAGARQTGGALELEVTKEVSQSHLTKLWNRSSFKKTPSSRLGTLADRVAKYFTVVVLAIAAGAALIWYPRDPAIAANVLTAVLIVACPCALALSAPFALGTALRISGNARLYLRNTGVIESLAHLTTIAFDKTGTLTRPAESSVTFTGKPLTEDEKSMLAALLQHSTHPKSRRILAALGAASSAPVESFAEEPGHGITGIVSGHTLRVGREDWASSIAMVMDRSWEGEAPAEPDSRDECGSAGASPPHQISPVIASAAKQSRPDGLVIASEAKQPHPDHTTPGPEVWLAIDHTLRGHFAIRDTFRQNFENEIAFLREKYEIGLLSGDNARSQPRLEPSFGESSMRYEQTPYDKQTYVDELRAAGKRVLMIGDGLNDAGALAAADVGIAITEDTATFTPASDGILDAVAFGSVHKFLQFAKGTTQVVMAGFVISFIYNIAGLGFAVAGKLSPLVSAILMPLSSISVVAFATLATRFQARRAGL